MSKGCVRALGFILLFGVFSVLLFKADVHAGWQNDITVQSGELPGDPDLRELGDCYNYEAGLSYVRNIKTHSNSLTTFTTDEGYEELPSNTSTKCMTSSSNGYFWNNWWAPTDPVKAVELRNVDGSILAAPNSDVYLHVHRVSSRTSTVSINEGFGPGINGKLGVRKVGQNHLKTFEFDASVLSAPLTYETGETIRTSPYRIWFSKNGRFAVLNVYARGFVVIDFENNTLTPFYKLSISRFSTLSASISSDGQTVSITDSVPQIFKLGECTSYSFDSIPVSIFDDIPEGCGSVFDATDLLRPGLNTYSGSMGAWLNQAGDKLVHDRRIPGTDTFRRYELYPSSLANENGEYDGLQGYLALGDSFVSGEGDSDGNAWYEPGTNVHGDVSRRNLCHVSRRSYSYLIARDLGYNQDLNTPDEDGLFHSVACSGAMIHNIIGGSLGENHSPVFNEDLSENDNQYPYISDEDMPIRQQGTTRQVNYLEESYLSPYEDIISVRTPEIVTLGIGGNDIGFSDIIKACLLPGTCDYAKPGSNKSNRLVNRVAHQKERLADAYRQIKQASPGTRVYVTGYPVFAAANQDDCGVNVRFNADERHLLEQGVLYMNEIVRAAATEAGVFYVDIGHSLLNNGLCSDSDELAFNGFAFGDDQDLNELCFTGCVGNESYHPNEFGHELIKDTLLNSTSDLINRMPEPVEVDIPLPGDYFGVQANLNVQAINNGDTLIPSVVADNAKYLIDLNTVQIEQTGLLPGSIAEVIVESDPIGLGLFEADSSGTLSVKVELPEDLAPGYHELRVVTTNINGQVTDYYTSFIAPHSEIDFDGDGILNEDDACGLVEDSGRDVDQDGIDDACDPLITEAPILVVDKIDNSESDSQAKIIPISNSSPPGLQLVAENTVVEGSSEREIRGDETSAIPNIGAGGIVAPALNEVLGASSTSSEQSERIDAARQAGVVRPEAQRTIIYVAAGLTIFIFGTSLVVLRVVKQGS